MEARVGIVRGSEDSETDSVTEPVMCGACEDADDGGNSEGVKEKLTSGVQHIYFNDRAFAALKADGSVVTWGDPENGGNSEEVKEALTSGVL